MLSNFKTSETFKDILRQNFKGTNKLVKCSLLTQN